MRAAFFLSSGTFQAPRFALVPGTLREGLAGYTMSNTVGVALRDDGSIVLVDVGWSEAECADRPLRSRALGMKTVREDAIVVQLRALGLDPSRVTTIIATHLHLDHVAGIVDFPNAELVCTEEELVAYQSFPRSPGYRNDLDRAGRIRALGFDRGARHGFPASRDLFDDGEIVLLDGHGHTRGSLAVAFGDARGRYVHIGDAAYGKGEYESGLPSLFAKMTAYDRASLVKTYGAIQACAAQPDAPKIVPSHDAAVLATLPRLPAYVA